MILQLAIAATVSLGVFGTQMAPASPDQSAALIQIASQAAPDSHYIMCFKTGEKISGMNKICYYDCAGSEAAITVKSHELCPLNIER